MTTSITTKLVKDGNSVAVRIPKTALEMSGLRGEVKMVVTRGQITLTSSVVPRSDWKVRIQEVLATNPTSLAPDSDLDVWESTAADGLDGEY
jgi:antitoxin component of MazEF toxin-antitoxin module